MSIYNKFSYKKQPDGSTVKVPKTRSGSGPRHAAVQAREGRVPEVTTTLTGEAPKHSHRKEVVLPPTVEAAAADHARSLCESVVSYYNNAIVTYYRDVHLGKVQLIQPQEKCPTCGSAPAHLVNPNAPARSGQVKVRIGVRFTQAVAQMVLELADNWFHGNWSAVMESAVRHYLGDLNPPPEGFGAIPGAKLQAGRKAKKPPKPNPNEAALLKSLGLEEG